MARAEARGETGVAARHDGIRGFSQERLTKAQVLVVGAGGIGSSCGLGLVRKGIGELHICDQDYVELSNLNRQFFFSRDVHHNKALCLGQNISLHGFLGTKVRAYAHSFEELQHVNALPRVDIIIVGVDNDATRLAVMEYCLANRVAGIFVAVSPDADNGYVFVYEPGEACIGCVLPDLVAHATDGRTPCTGTPACLDVLLCVGGLAVYAVDTVLMDRPRTWNFRRFFLSGEGQDVAWKVTHRPDCEVCGSGACHDGR